MRLDGEGMDPVRQFSGQGCIDHAMPFDPGLPFEAWRHNIDPEMRLAARPVARMAGMQMRFIRHVDLGRSESFAQLLCDGILDGHEFGLTVSSAVRQLRVSSGARLLKFAAKAGSCDVKT